MPQSRRTVLVQLAATSVLAACDPEGKVGTPEDSALDSGKPEDTGSPHSGDSGWSEQPFPEGLSDECLTDAPDLETCPRTPPSSEGPFYREGTPFRENFDVRGEDATHIIVTGRIVAEETCEPVPGAGLIVWHATPLEIYDNGEDFHCRGRVACDEQGYFCFYTCRPPPYPNGDNTGWLAAHFHIHVAVGDRIVHTTQLYFEGDPYLESFIPPALIKQEEEVEPGVVAITHDFSLSPEALA
ncbi:MAG: hypothetical protein H6741_29080 [Alphaproteobacteria bacterium]|nr:hypothetical protein [Alphaproteobacteria bacterium]MCB9796773.1 hypothetical protein [Alphaproteobacteria bacterium]